ncbi:helix-turn-helix domain-containing protein [Anaerotruncus rubiinfantis]|uniref:helix-turn-helix domain-containing protein n=1 Tax=Anaerotruncus rubiinfantis TaxID=1720200 RepID=UPI001896E330
MKFFAVFESLCTEKGKSANAIAKELKIPSGSITAWKGGAEPRPATLSKIAAYFGVSTDYLLGNTDIKNKPAATEDDELDEQERNLIDLFRLLPEEDRDTVAVIIEGILKRKGLLK